MATVSLAAISAALTLIFQDQTVAQFRQDVVLPNLLGVKRGRNDMCTWPAKFEGRTAGGAYGEGADMADGDFDSHDRTKASLNWASYRKGAKVSGLAQSIAAASGGTGAGDLTDVLLEEVVDAVNDLAIDVSIHSYSGNPGASPVQLAGAALAIDSDTGSSFAGVDPATYSEWVSGENTLPTAQLSESNLSKYLHRPVRDATGSDPDFVTCSGALFDKVRDLGRERGDPPVVMVRTAGGMVDVRKHLGMRAVTVDGVPYIEDRHATANTFYAFSGRFVEYRQIPARGSSATPEEVRQAMFNLTGVDVPVHDIERGLRAMFGGQQIVPYVEVLGKTGDAFKVMVKVYLQLAWKRRNAFAKLTLT